jgi:type II secretory pathway pseudopilin PulG
MKRHAILAALIAATLVCAPASRAQDGKETEPVAALAAALDAACRANQQQFVNYLTADNAAAYAKLSSDQKTQFMERFSLSDQPGRPLISADDRNHTVLRCVAPAGTAEFRFGDARVHENLAFIPVAAVNSQETVFGLVRENGGWRLLSLGLVMLDIPQLTKQWAEGDLLAREDAAIANLRGIADAVQAYRTAWGKLPQALAQMGPAPKEEISPEQAALLSDKLAAGSSGGYLFRYRVVGAAEEDSPKFEVSAVPEDYGKTGKRSFLLDAEGKIHAEDHRGAIATAEDDTIP